MCYSLQDTQQSDSSGTGRFSHLRGIFSNQLSFLHVTLLAANVSQGNGETVEAKGDADVRTGAPGRTKHVAGEYYGRRNLHSEDITGCR